MSNKSSSNSSKPRIKQSFIAGALTSSAGIFVSKALGLLYVSPLSRMAGADNTVFYSCGYTYYNILLQICSAGLPFAIAALVSKYATRNDYKTVLLLRKLAMSIMLGMGFILCVTFLFIANPLAKQALGSQASVEDVAILVNVFRILVLSVLTVPFLSSFRCFWQGLKELKPYAFSQVLEQFVRVFSMLALGAFCVYVLQLDGIYAIYMAMFSTFLAAAVALIYYFKFDKQHISWVRRAARAQEKRAAKPKKVILELIAFGLPFAISSILGNSMDIVNNTFFMGEIVKVGYTQQEGMTILSMIQYQSLHLIAIPQVLATGFPSGIVPYMTSALERRDIRQLKRYIGECLDVVMYIGIPLCMCLCFLAKPIYSLFYGTQDLDLGASVLQWSTTVAIAGTFSPICTSMMMTLKMRGQVLIYLAITFAFKLISFFPMVQTMGWQGAIVSSALASCVLIFLSLKAINNRYGMNYWKNILHLGKIIICVIAMNGVFVLFDLFGIDGSYSGIIVNFLILALKGSLGIAVYVWVSFLLHLPQALLHRNTKGILNVIRSRLPMFNN